MEKFLPVSIQNFEEMIRGNFIYVDKTQYIYEMVRIPQAFYFLSRPRRFGKTLLVSTLRALFEGKRDFFKGLWIDQADWEWKKHPVVLIDFSEISSVTPADFKKGILKTLHVVANQHELQIDGELLPESFKDLILGLHQKYNRKVVVLVDEYDRPLISHLGMGEAELETAARNRTILKDFFGTLKGGNVSAALRFAFFTGITKFAKVSIFSDLNNLDDLTMQTSFSSILGYTEEELRNSFYSYIKNLSSHLHLPEPETYLKIQQWYNGYRFSTSNMKMYNPFSILKLLKHQQFQNYWFETATPSFLVNLIKEKKYNIPAIESLELSQENFSVYDLDNLKIEPLLFQTGYLTIESFQEELYRLGYPNQEVKSSFLSYIYDQIVELPDSSQKVQYKRLHSYLREKAIDKFINTVNSILSSIPYLHIYDQNERYYHTVFYLMLSASGIEVRTEVLTSWGQIDIEVYFEDKIYIIELKCNQPADKAIAQIKDKKYYEKHLAGNKEILIMGINFDTKQRRIADWKMVPIEINKQ